MKMYNNPLHSDVSIVVGASRIAAHRQVLATHSKVFQRMWEHDLREVRPPAPAQGNLSVLGGPRLHLAPHPEGLQRAAAFR